MIDARYRAQADPVRRRLLRVMEDIGRPLDATSLAEAVGLHPNTVRGHLDILEQAAMVTKAPEARQAPGRPRLLYSPAQGTDQPPGGYRLLAEMLTTMLNRVSDETSAAAEETGRAWGRYLTQAPPPSTPLSAEEALERLLTIVTDHGFVPQTRDAAGSTEIDLLDCPFRDLARQHPEIVCALHLGMLRGTAEALGGPIEIASLQPFVGPSTCRTIVDRT